MKKIVYIAMALFTMTSCGKLTDLNEDPNHATDTDPNLLLAGAQHALATEISDEWMNGRTGMTYAQYWSQNDYTDESRYQIREGVNDGFWTVMYAKVLNNLEEIKRVNTKVEDPLLKLQANNQDAIADLMQVYVYQMLTDMYGAVPYHNVLGGADDFTPAYDSKEVIYQDMIARVDNAFNTLDENNPGFDGNDKWYKGDVASWKRFANALKLRLAVRYKDSDASKADEMVQEVLASGYYINSNEDNAVFNFQAFAPENHPLNQNALTRNDFALSKALVDPMVAKNDPRRWSFGDVPINDRGDANAEMVGLTYGLNNGNAKTESQEGTAVSLPSGYYAARHGGEFKESDVLRPDAPVVFLDAAEVQFILAEMLPSAANTHFRAGVQFSLDYWMTDAAVAADYINNLPAAPTMSDIAYEKWIALYMQGIQGWFERVRLEEQFPADHFQPVADGSRDPYISEPQIVPYRMTYPVVEYSTNESNVKDAVTGIDGGADTQAPKNLF